MPSPPAPGPGPSRRPGAPASERLSPLSSCKTLPRAAPPGGPGKCNTKIVKALGWLAVASFSVGEQRRAPRLEGGRALAQRTRLSLRRAPGASPSRPWPLRPGLLHWPAASAHGLSVLGVEDPHGEHPVASFAMAPRGTSPCQVAGQQAVRGDGLGLMSWAADAPVSALRLPFLLQDVRLVFSVAATLKNAFTPWSPRVWSREGASEH